MPNIAHYTPKINTLVDNPYTPANGAMFRGYTTTKPQSTHDFT